MQFLAMVATLGITLSACDESPKNATAADHCEDSGTAVLPAWAHEYTGFAGRKIVSTGQNVIGVVFADILRANVQSGQPSDKILWVVRQPRDHQPLIITGRLAGSNEQAKITQSGDSGPGEIYPTDVNMPLKGCWHLTLSWNGHTDTIDLSYV